MRNTKTNDLDMYVLKRNGKREAISFDKILKRIKSLGKHFNLQHIIFAQLAIKVIDQLYDNIQKFIKLPNYIFITNDVFYEAI